MALKTQKKSSTKIKSSEDFDNFLSSRLSQAIYLTNNGPSVSIVKK